MPAYKYNKLILTLVLFGLLTSLYLSTGRHHVEQANRTVDMLFEYDEIVYLAGQSGKSVSDTMQLFKQSGITSLVVCETTAERLEKRGIISLFAGTMLLSDAQAGSLTVAWQDLVAQEQIKNDEVYISGIFGDNMLEIQEDLVQRFGAERVRLVKEAKPRIIAVKTDYEALYERPLGILTSDLRTVQSYGFHVVPRPTNYHAVTKENVDSVFTRLDKANVSVSAILFAEQEVLGYPYLLPSVAEKFKERRWTLGMTEHPLQLQFDKQEGLVDLADLVDYQVARLYVIEKKEQEKRLDVSKAVRRWALTDEERNVRMNFMRMFHVATPGKTLLETNLEYVQLIRDDVLKRGFTLGSAGIFQPYFPVRLFYLPVIFGATAAGVLYLSILTSWLTHRRQLLLVIGLGVALSLSFLFVVPLLTRQMVALFSAIIFPVLAMVWQMGNWEKLVACEKKHSMSGILFTTSLQLVATVFLSLVGGAYVSGILCDTRFFLEIDIYRGVKLTFLMPLVLITLVYLKKYTVFGDKIENQKGLVGQLEELLNYPVYLKTLFLIGCGLIVAYIFIGRTGHTSGIPVPGIELKMRYFLEEVMYARPREKEFLVGHPSFFLAALAAWRNLPHLIYYCMIIGATIGQGCLVETFAHMRTPVVMSFIRALDGLWMGGIFGIFAFLAGMIALALFWRFARRYAGEA